jgi:8-oxo-dGTP pyrophosphatase MutT (NUDIX family)
MGENMIRRVTARGIVFKDGKLLCARLQPYKGSIAGDYWCVPGGGVDPGEALIAALEREMIEETGIKPVIGKLLYIQQFTLKDVEQLEFFFHITNTEDYEHIDLTKASHAHEIDTIEFVDPKTVYLLPEFLTNPNPT